jgi:glycosyltransferase involved in cell wall biosynthesis
MDGPLVTIGVPVFRGHEDLPTTLECLRTQTYASLDVLISVDGPGDPSVEAAQPFLQDPRFRLHVQPSRRGWAGNLDWTMRNRRGTFFIFQQHDDQVSPTCVADLVAAAARWPKAAVCFSEMDVSGSAHQLVRHKSILGDAVSRALTHIERLETSMFRGLIRGASLDAVGGLQVTEFESFGSLHVFLAELALLGEFRFVEGPTYYKRIHGNNLHLKWFDWPERQKRAAWALLAAQLTEALMKAGTSPLERWHLWLTVADRFLMSRGGDRWMFCTVDEEDETARRAVLAEILERLRTTARVDLAAALETSWPSIEDLTWRRFSRD